LNLEMNLKSNFWMVYLLDNEPKNESKENLELQARMAIIEKTGEPFHKNEPKTEPYNEKLKIEPKDDSDSELQTINMPAFKNEFKSEFLDVKVKLEPRDEFELQDGLTILDEMDQSIFNKNIDVETFANNSRITIKKEVEDKDSQARPKFLEKLSNIKKIALNFKCIACDDTFENLSDVDFHEKDFINQSSIRKKRLKLLKTILKTKILKQDQNFWKNYQLLRKLR